MKILLYSLIFAPDVCSNAYVFSDLATELKRQGHDVTVITTTPHYDETTAIERRKLLNNGKKKWYMKSDFGGIGVFHIVVSPSKGGFVKRFFTYSRFFRYSDKLLKYEKIDADVVLGQTPPFYIGKPISKLAKTLKAKSALICQDLFVDSMIKKGKLKWPFSTIAKKVELRTLNKMDVISTISQDMLEQLQNKSLNTKLALIPNFVDTSIYHPIKDEFRKSYELEDDDFVVSYVGNIGNAQDLTPLIELAKARPDVKILIAGNGVKEQQYRDIVNNEKLDNIKFLGYVSREETCRINAASDICMIMLAKHVLATSFPSKTYSLMAMGKPIVITSGENSCAGKFIEENRLGRSVLTTDYECFINTINELMTHKKQLEEFGMNSLKLIQTEYSAEVVTKKYVQLFNEMLY